MPDNTEAPTPYGFLDGGMSAGRTLLCPRIFPPNPTRPVRRARQSGEPPHSPKLQAAPRTFPANSRHVRRSEPEVQDHTFSKHIDPKIGSSASPRWIDQLGPDQKLTTLPISFSPARRLPMKRPHAVKSAAAGLLIGV